jgi:predicted histone-like DNA-binding protein
MALKVKAKEQLIKIGKYADSYRYVMAPELYIALSQSKVIQEAALRSGVSRGVMQACWDAAGEVIKAWATEGHAVALPGLGTMRFGLRAKSVADVNDVKASLISSRRIIFTPTSGLKEELAKTSVQITCFDRNGVEVKRVTSSDEGKVEDPEDGTDPDNGGTTDPDNGGNDAGNQGGGNLNPETPVNPETPAGESFTIAAGVGSDGGGSVTIKKNGAAVEGGSVEATGSDTVVLQAVPENDNWQFMSWSDGNSQNPRTIQPSADMNVTANFLDLSKI